MSYESLEKIEESLLRTASELAGKDNNFDVALSIGEEFKAAGLTPLYYLDYEESLIRVTTEERRSKQYS